MGYSEPDWEDMYSFFIAEFENKAESGEVQSAYSGYALLLNHGLLKPSRKAIDLVCESMIEVVPIEEVEELEKSILVCGRERLEPWLADRQYLAWKDSKQKSVPRLKLPWWAKFRKFDGNVTIEFQVDKLGKPINIEVLAADKKILIKPSIEALEKTRYEPATFYGEKMISKKRKFKFSWVAE